MLVPRQTATLLVCFPVIKNFSASLLALPCEQIHSDLLWRCGTCWEGWGRDREGPELPWG